MQRPIVIFDTSAVNKLSEHTQRDTLLAELKDSYFLRLSESMLAELAANPDAEKRKALFEIPRTLMKAGEVIRPFHLILQDCVSGFEMQSCDFDWRKIAIRFPEAEKYLSARLPLDDISAAQLNQARTLEEQYKNTFKRIEADFERVFRSGNVPRRTLPEMMAAFMRPEGSMWEWARIVAERPDGSAPVETENLPAFLELCPPFRALVIALCISSYERCMRDPKQGPSMRAGRADTYMATYLPYCDQFVTDDEKQISLFREIVNYASLPNSSVLSFTDFLDGLSAIQHH